MMNRRSEIYPDYVELERDDDDPPLDEDETYRPRQSRPGFGWARRGDIEDRRSQSEAPRGHGRYDPRPADRYEEGLSEFIEEHPSPRRTRGLRRFDLLTGRWEGEGDPRRVHAGRGPRGYRRSDERILEDVCDALTAAGDVDASEIEVNVADCLVTLSGMVDSRRTKRRAEDIAASITGVHDVQNQLRVATRL